MKHKTLFGLLPLFAIALTSCGGGAPSKDLPKKINEELVKTFVNPEPTKYDKITVEGEANILNKYDGFNYFTKTSNYSKNYTSRILGVKAQINYDNFFGYKFKEVDTLEIGQHLTLHDEVTKYEVTDIVDGEAKLIAYEKAPRAAYSLILKEGVEEGSYALEGSNKQYLTITKENKLGFLPKISEQTSWKINLDAESKKATITNYAGNKGLAIEGDALKVANDSFTEFSLANTFVDNKIVYDVSTVYGSLHKKIIIAGSLSYINLQKYSGTIKDTIRSAEDTAVAIEITDGLHLSVRNASCEVTLRQSVHLGEDADPEWEDATIWARWDIDLYYNNEGLLTFEKVKSSNFGNAPLNECAYSMATYTYVA